MVENLIDKIESQNGTDEYLQGYDHQALLQLIQLSGYFRIFINRYSRGEEFSEEDQDRIKDFEIDFDNLINSVK